MKKKQLSCSQGITKFIRTHFLENMNVCTNFHGKSSNICRDIFVWTNLAH